MHSLQEPARPCSCAIHPKAVLAKLFFLLELEDALDRPITVWWRQDWSRVVAWTRAEDLNETLWILPCRLSATNHGGNYVTGTPNCGTIGSSSYAPSLLQSQRLLLGSGGRNTPTLADRIWGPWSRGLRHHASDRRHLARQLTPFPILRPLREGVPQPLLIAPASCHEASPLALTL